MAAHCSRRCEESRRQVVEKSKVRTPLPLEERKETPPPPKSELELPFPRNRVVIPRTTFNKIDMLEVQIGHKEILRSTMSCSCSCLRLRGCPSLPVLALKGISRSIASIADDSVIYRGSVKLNVGFAARKDLFTPVMRNAERAPCLDQRINMLGGTFTLFVFTFSPWIYVWRTDSLCGSLERWRPQSLVDQLISRRQGQTHRYQWIDRRSSKLWSSRRPSTAG